MALQILLPSPVLLEAELEAIKTRTSLKNQTFSLHYHSGREGALKDAVAELCSNVEAAVREGCEVIILSDRMEGELLEADSPPIPTLLAVGAVHHHLIRSVRVYANKS